MPAFLTTDRLRGFALRPLRIPHQGDRIRTYGSLKLLHRLFRRIFLKRIVTTNDLFDWKVPRKNTIEQKIVTTDDLFDWKIPRKNTIEQRIVTTDDLFDWKVPRKNTIEQRIVTTDDLFDRKDPRNKGLWQQMTYLTEKFLERKDCDNRWPIWLKSS